MRSLRSLAVTTALAASLLVVAPTEAAPPPTYSAPEAIPGTTGAQTGGPWSTSAPNGSDLAVWVSAPTPTTFQVEARLRRPGSTTWQALPALFAGQTAPIANINLVGTSGGDFWAVAVLGFLSPQVYAAKLNGATGTWGQAIDVFGASQPGYYHGLNGFGSNSSVGISGDGTLFVGGYGQPVGDPGKSQSLVGVLMPGSSTFGVQKLSAENVWGAAPTVAVSPTGHAIVGFTTGQIFADITTWGGSRAPGGLFVVKALSPTGGSDFSAFATIGASGRGAVAYGAPSVISNSVVVSRTLAGSGVWEDTVVPPAFPNPFVLGLRAVTDAAGDVTVVWQAIANPPGQVVRFAHVRGATASQVYAVTPDTELAAIESVVQRADGSVGVMTRQTDPNNPAVATHKLVTLTDTAYTQPLPVGDAADTSLAQLSFDAASRGNVVYGKGASPNTSVFWAGQLSAPPDVMTGPYSGAYQTKAKLKVKNKKKHRLSCTTPNAYFVEAASVKYQWYRGKKLIKKKAKKPVYTWVTKDVGKKLSCRVIASNPYGKVVLKSNKRKIKK